MRDIDLHADESCVKSTNKPVFKSSSEISLKNDLVVDSILHYNTSGGESVVKNSI